MPPQPLIDFIHPWSTPPNTNNTFSSSSAISSSP